MMNDCPICGKNHVITWPEFWPYRHSEIFFCSDQCLDVYNVRVLHKTNGWIPEKQKGNTKKMGYAKVKKDGSPAKKSGPKPKKLETQADKVTKAALEHPERPIVQIDGQAIVEKMMEQTPKITKPLAYSGFTVRAIEGKYGRFSCYKIDNIMYFNYESLDRREEIDMPIYKWKAFLEEIQEAAAVLGVEL